MTFLPETELKELIGTSGEPCVSIYLPTHPAGPETRQDPIRLKNLLSEVQSQLAAGKWFHLDAVDLLKPIAALIEQHEFWQRQQQGLAVFCQPQMFRTYSLPVSVQELAIVTHRFHLKPLMPLLTQDTKFFILAASQNQLRLFRATQHTVELMNIADLLQNLAEALQYDDPEKQLQFHSGTSGSSPIYHGQGVGTTDNKDEILRYFQVVDEGLQALLRDQQAPLVFVGVEYLFPIYQQANSYPSLFETCVTGNPDQLAPATLHQQAWPVIKPYFEQVRQRAIAQYQDLSATDQTCTDLKTTVQAAHDGQVDTLFVNRATQVWGEFDPQTRKVEVHDSAQEDLLDLAAIQTWLRGGQVHILDAENMPADTPLASVLRYSVT